GITFSSIHPESEISNSQLNIQSINFQQQSITGTFQFVGYAPIVSNDTLNPTVSIQAVTFSQGTFLNVPYANGIVENPDEPGNGEGPGNGGGPSSGDYFPMAVGNKWVYTNMTEPYEIIGTQTLNGIPYYKMSVG